MSNAQEMCDTLYAAITDELKERLPNGCGFVIAIAGPEGDISVGAGGLPERHPLYAMMQMCIASDVLKMHGTAVSREVSYYGTDDNLVEQERPPEPPAWPFPTGRKD